MRNVILNGDCLQLMKDIPAGSVDMVLCDLPYGTTQNKWDSIIDLPSLWLQYRRVIKPNGAIVLTAAQPFTSLLICSNLHQFKYSWIWEKDIPTGHLNAKKQPLRLFEDVCVFSTKTHNYFPQDLVYSPKINTRYKIGDNYGKSGNSNFSEFSNYPKNIIRTNRETGLHPTQKPVALFEYLIKTYTQPGALVLDNCAGSGTTGIACRNTGRDYILIEKELEYYQVIKNRLDIKDCQSEVSQEEPSSQLSIF